MDRVASSLLAAALWATANVLDKIVASRVSPRPLDLVLISTGIAFAGGSAFVLVADRSPAAPPGILLAMLSGAFYAAGLCLYFRAMRSGAAETNALLLQFIPAMTLLLGAVFLGESFGLRQYGGLAVFAAAGTLISAWPLLGKRRGAPAALLPMCLACAGWAGSSVLAKHVLGFMGLPSFFFWARAGALVAGAAFWLVNAARRRASSGRGPLGRPAMWALLLGSEAVNTVGLLLSNYALTRGPVSLCSGVVSTQPLFVLVMAMVLQRSLGIDLSGRHATPVGVLLVAAAMACAGVVLVSAA